MVKEANVPDELTGRATGKLLLFGEHAAVYGHPALGISLPWTLVLKVAPTADGYDAATSRIDGSLLSLPEPLAATLDMPHMHAVVEIHSQIPIGLGFGSSAALCVAVERAMADAAALPRSATAVWRGAHERERVFHGTPSGADTTFATWPGVGFLTWVRGSGALPSYQPVLATELHLVVAAVPRRGDTKAHIAAVAQRIRAGDTETQSTLRRLGHCSTQARTILLGSGPPGMALGAVADRAQWLLAELGLGDPAQDQLLHDGRTAGASGGKLSGSGGGGACFLVCHDAPAATRVLDAIRTQATVAAHIAVSANHVRQIAPESRSPTVSRWWYAPPVRSRVR